MENTTEVKKDTRLRRLLPLALALVLVIGLALAVPTFLYETRFLPKTEIAGVPCGFLTAEEAGEALYAAAEDAYITLRDGGGEAVVTLSLSAFATLDELEELADSLLSGQRQSAGALDWMFAQPESYALRLLEGTDTAAVAAVLEDTLYGGTARVAPEDAYIEFGETGYTVVPEVKGNLVDLGRCAEALTDALHAVDDLAAEIPDVKVQRGIIRPTVTTDDWVFRTRCRIMDDYLALSVTLDFPNGEYTLTPEDIWSVSDFILTPSAIRCAPDLDRALALADQLVEDYGVDGVYAKYLHAEDTREYIYYRVGDNGWIMDRTALGEDIYNALSDKKSASVVPDYDYTWYWKKQYRGWGVKDTFVEISLDNQYMWYYVDGELLVETPVVTGNLSDPNSLTRRGCFRVTYKDSDTFLVGPTWNDHVDYWLPFDGNIGLHDSSWRDEYGGDIYLTDGSHGCINTPLDAIRVIFENIKAGDVVIVY